MSQIPSSSSGSALRAASMEVHMVFGDVKAGHPVQVRVFGSLRPSRVDRGLPCEFTVDVPPEGVVARTLAESLGLPMDRVEGVFVNHVVHGLGAHISPGDRIAFVPNDTPGPHRVFLGLYDAGRDDDA